MSANTLTPAEIDQVKRSCPSLSEPWTVTPSLLRALEAKMRRDHWKSTSANAFYRNRVETGASD